MRAFTFCNIDREPLQSYTKVEFPQTKFEPTTFDNLSFGDYLNGQK